MEVQNILKATLFFAAAVYAMYSATAYAEHTSDDAVFIGVHLLYFGYFVAKVGEVLKRGRGTTKPGPDVSRSES